LATRSITRVLALGGAVCAHAGGLQNKAHSMTADAMAERYRRRFKWLEPFLLSAMAG